MKKIINKNTIIGIIIGILICGTVGVIAYSADSITFTTNKNSNVKTVADALDDLYSKKDESISELVWTNSNPTSNFTAQTISLDLSDYKYIVIIVKTSTNDDCAPRSSVIFPVTETYPQYTTAISINAGSPERNARVNISGVEISNEFKFNDNSLAIPYKIYGIKKDLNIDIWND